jgi:ABC-2 type transport system ATP-binding protein
MLTGVLEPTSGTARIGGHDILAEPRAVKQINGLVPQDLALYPTLSARANLQFFGRIYGLRGKALRERVDDVLEIVALADRADEAIEKYSGGMQRRVNIAAGLVHQPRLLFLDEPTVGVDPQSRNHIFESVQRLNRDRRMSIIYTSHYMEEVELLCNRVAIVDQGRIIALDTPRRLIETLIEPHVIEVYGDGVAEWAERRARPIVDRLEVSGETAFCYVDDVEPLLAVLRTEESLKVLRRAANLEDVFIKLTGRDIRD